MMWIFNKINYIDIFYHIINCLKVMIVAKNTDIKPDKKITYSKDN
jgi:hypothetical protein